jgi:hypothetical protein
MSSAYRSTFGKKAGMSIAKPHKEQRKSGFFILRSLRSGREKGFGPSCPDQVTLHNGVLAESDNYLYGLKIFE